MKKLLLTFLSKRKEQFMTEGKSLRNQKDSVFRMLYRDRGELLDLYNALNETAYDDPDEPDRKV